MPPRIDWSRSDYKLTAAQRMDARNAYKLLAGSSISLEDAARFALDGKRAITRVTVEDAAERFVLSRVRKKTRRGAPLRPATIDWYEDFLHPIRRDFGSQFIDTIDRNHFSEWLHALKVGETARAAIARAARALWHWALEENPPLVTQQITIGLSFSGGIRHESERLVLTVHQADAILRASTWDRSALALMLFGGVRPEEIAGPDKEWLRWEHVNTAENYIRVPSDIAKNGKTRLVEKLPDTLWAWLKPGSLRDDISPFSARAIRERAQRTAGIATWPHDCFRHTVATYLLAFRQDAGVVAEWIGHEGKPALLHQTYRGQLTLDRTQVNHEMAQRYLALRPAKS